MLSVLVRRQLVAFVVVSVIGMSLLGVRYIGIPEQLGMGRYDVRLSMPEAAGLYDGAPVTYRGVQIGEVTRTSLTATGTSARLSLDDDHRVPSSARAEIRNGSVIGEPYVDLVADETGKGGKALRDGDAIPSSRVSLPVPTATMLTKVRDLMASVPQDEMRTTLQESAEALGGSGSDLRRIVDSGSELTSAATAAEKPTVDLIENSRRVLATQDALRSDIRAWATGLQDFTGALDRADADVRAVLQRGGPAADAVTGLMRDLSTSVPALAQDAADLGRVLNVYQPALKHLLIVLPGLVEANGSAQVYYPDQQYGESGLSFKMTVNNPPICLEGFPEAKKMRAPQDLRPKALPENSYCKVPGSDPRIVRGARNMPCPQDPSRRGAVAADCGLVFNPRESPR